MFGTDVEITQLVTSKMSTVDMALAHVSHKCHNRLCFKPDNFTVESTVTNNARKKCDVDRKAVIQLTLIDGSVGINLPF